MPSITITEVEFQQLPGTLQRLLMAKFLPDLIGQSSESPDVDDDSRSPTNTSITQAIISEIFDSLSPKTQQVMRIIASHPVTGFMLDDLAKKIGVRPGGLGGCWSGLTKVSKRVMKDPSLKFVIWSTDANGAWHGRLMPDHWDALRKFLGIVK